MITMTTHPLVEDYLQRLSESASSLPPERRHELVAEIREHVQEALRGVAPEDEVAVRNVLERLGTPEEIVSVAAGPPDDEAVRATTDRAGRLEIAALIALVVPVLGWLVGLALVGVSRAWSGREKLVGVALLVLPLLLPLLGVVAEAAPGQSPVVPVGEDAGLPEAGSDSISTWEILAVFGLLFAGVPSALYLGWRLRRSRSALV